MKFDDNTLIFYIWLLVGVVYVIYLVAFICCVHTKHLKDNMYDTNGIPFFTFNFLGKAIAKGLIYFIEALVIGVLLNTLNGMNDSIGAEAVDTIIKIAVQCIFPIMSLVYLVDLLNALQENFSLKPIDNKKYSPWRKYGLLLFPSIFCCLFFILSISIYDDRVLEDVGKGIKKMKIGNWISVGSIIVSLIIAVSSWIYTAYTTWKNNRPRVVIAYKHYKLAGMNRYLVIQNLGKTTAKIENISATLGSNNIDLPSWEGITLVPGQSDTFYLKEGAEGKLNISIKYVGHNKSKIFGEKEFQEKFTYNINKERDMEFADGDKVAKYLAEIAQGIQELKNNL